MRQPRPRPRRRRRGLRPPRARKVVSNAIRKAIALSAIKRRNDAVNELLARADFADLADNVRPIAMLDEIYDRHGGWALGAGAGKP